MSLQKLRLRWEDDIKVDGVRVWVNSSGLHAIQKYAGQDDISCQMLLKEPSRPSQSRSRC
jgi:hypothetical protein